MSTRSCKASHVGIAKAMYTGDVRTRSRLGTPAISRVLCGLVALGVLSGARPAALQQRSVPFIRSQLTWFDRAGKKLGVIGSIADYGNLELSPDGRTVAAAVMADAERGTHDLWLVNVATGQHTVFVAEAA